MHFQAKWVPLARSPPPLPPSISLVYLSLFPNCSVPILYAVLTRSIHLHQALQHHQQLKVNRDSFTLFPPLHPHKLPNKAILSPPLSELSQQEGEIIFLSKHQLRMSRLIVKVNTTNGQKFVWNNQNGKKPQICIHIGWLSWHWWMNGENERH